MASVKLGGSTIISDTEGGWNFTPGIIGNGAEIIQFARSTMLRVRQLSNSGTTHKLIIDFAGTETQCNSFKARIQALYDYRIGTLVVDNAGSYPNCTLLGKPTFGNIYALENNRFLLTLSMDVTQLG